MCSHWLLFLPIWSRVTSSFLAAFGGSGAGPCAGMLGLMFAVTVCLAAGRKSIGITLRAAKEGCVEGWFHSTKHVEHVARNDEG